MDDIAEVVSKSADVNFSQLVGTQTGEVVVPMYDWAEFLDHLNVVPQIKKMHHFHFSKAKKGKVVVQEAVDGEKKEVVIAGESWKPSFNELPRRILPHGLSLERRWYLFNKIREFCSPETRDIVCPCPDPGYVSEDSCRSTSMPPPTTPTPPPTSSTRSKRKCGKCGQTGHNARTCKGNTIKANFDHIEKKFNLFTGT